MMKLVRLCVARPIATIIIFLAVSLLGGVSYTMLKLDLMPDISYPVLTVITPYPGAGPMEVENNVTDLLENMLSSVPGLEKISSKSEENVSMISLTFDWNKTIDEATNDVRDKLDLLNRKLPKEAEKPTLLKMDISLMPILILSVDSSLERFPTLMQFTEDNIINQLKQVPGVAQVQAMGGVKRQFRIMIDRKKLESFKLPYEQIALAVNAYNMTIPGGKIVVDKISFLLRTPGEFTSIDEIRSLIVGINPTTGSSIRLRDVALIEDTVNEQELFVETAKGPALAIIVMKQSQANTVEVTEAVLARIKEVEKELPPDVHVTIIRNMSEQIVSTIDNLKGVVITGALWVVVVILLFLRNLHAGLIVGVTIPLSLILTFLLMYFNGYTLNMISLTTIAIAIGMIVDNAIVIIENIVHHIERGKRPADAAVEGTSEVTGAIIASILTTIVVFVPLIFVGDMVGIMFRQLAFVITVALVSSLIFAIFLVPTLSAHFVKRQNLSGIVKYIHDALEWLFVKLESGYSRLLGITVRHKLISFSVITGLSMFSLVLVPYVGTEYMPKMDDGMISVSVTMPPGTTREETGLFMKTLIKRLHHEVPEKSADFAAWGKSDETGMASSFGLGEFSDNQGILFITLIDKAKRKRSDQAISDSLQHIVHDYPGAVVHIAAMNMLTSVMFGGDKPIDIQIYGANTEVAKSLSESIESELKRIDGIVNVDNSFKQGSPEYLVEVDREKASNLGVNLVTIGMTLRAGFNGSKIAKYREEGKEYDIFFRLREEDRKTQRDILDLKIPTAAGGFVELGSIAKITEAQGPLRIERKNKERVIRVTAEIQGRDLGSVSTDVSQLLSKIKTPPGIHVKLGGERAEQQKSFDKLFLALIIGIILVFMVMAVQFESLVQPLIILTAIPFAMMGALWAFVMTGNSLSLLSFIGLILLVGIVVNNGIVLIDYTNLLRSRHYSIVDAVMEAGRSRLRPVLMTTITTIVGMIPLAQSTGQGAELWNSMATVVIGGLVVSTFITLFLVPILFAAIEVMAEWWAARKKPMNQEADLSKESA
ncbi:efflux RND transporter permease subunit [Myxococcota bacterium]|nr:efflux RND transporter permease subunit [Myxococcota bacterium]